MTFSLRYATTQPQANEFHYGHPTIILFVVLLLPAWALVAVAKVEPV
jgi:hypothetical protein